MRRCWISGTCKTSPLQPRSSSAYSVRTWDEGSAADERRGGDLTPEYLLLNVDQAELPNPLDWALTALAMDQIAAGKTSKERGGCGSAARCSTAPPRAQDSRRTSPSRSGPGWTRTSSSARARSARRPAASGRTAPRTGCGSSSSRAASGCTAARAGTATTPTRRTRAPSAAHSPAAATTSGGWRSAARSAARCRGSRSRGSAAVPGSSA